MGHSVYNVDISKPLTHTMSAVCPVQLKSGFIREVHTSPARPVCHQRWAFTHWSRLRCRTAVRSRPWWGWFKRNKHFVHLENVWDHLFQLMKHETNTFHAAFSFCSACVYIHIYIYILLYLLLYILLLLCILLYYYIICVSLLCLQRRVCPYAYTTTLTLVSHGTLFPT